MIQNILDHICAMTREDGNYPQMLCTIYETSSYSYNSVVYTLPHICTT